MRIGDRKYSKFAFALVRQAAARCSLNEDRSTVFVLDIFFQNVPAKEETNMKTPVLLSTIGLAALLPLGAQEQNTESAPYHSSDTRKISKKLAGFSAKVGGNGTTLTADRNHKIWMVSNPETLSGIDGRHVKVKALEDVAQSQIRIVSVSAIADEQAGVRLMTPPSGGDHTR
jgi:hypothetical protein